MTTNAITCSEAPTTSTSTSTMAANTPRKMAHKCRSAIWLLLLMLAATQRIVHARNLPDRLDADTSVEATGLIETGPPPSPVDGIADNGRDNVDGDDYLDWLEQRLLREMETLRRTVRNIEQHKRYSKRSGDQQQQQTVRPPLSDQQLDELYRHLSLPLLSLLHHRSVPAKRSSNTMNASSSTSTGNEKRPQIVTGSFMSLCHFKICNMGRKRSVRSLLPESRLIDRPAFEQ